MSRSQPAPETGGDDPDELSDEQRAMLERICELTDDEIGEVAKRILERAGDQEVSTS